MIKNIPGKGNSLVSSQFVKKGTPIFDIRKAESIQFSSQKDFLPWSTNKSV